LRHGFSLVPARAARQYQVVLSEFVTELFYFEVSPHHTAIV
jgi:hypothetical protein